MMRKDKRIEELQICIRLCKEEISKYTQEIDQIIKYSNKKQYSIVASNDLNGSNFIYIYEKTDTHMTTDANYINTITIPEELRYLSKYFARYSNNETWRNIMYRLYYKSNIPDEYYGRVFRLYKPGVKETVTEFELIPTSSTKPYFILDLMKEYYMNKINILNEEIDRNYKELEEYIK